MARSTSLVASCALLLALGLSALVSPALAQAPSPLAFQFTTVATAKNCSIGLAQPDPNNSAINVNLAQVTLAPCAMLSMHSHQDVDELVYVQSGIGSASTTFPNGTVTTAQLSPALSFGFPRNLVHDQINTNCKHPLVTLNFFTNVNKFAVGVAAAAFNLPGSPFAAYASAANQASIQAATGLFAYDAQCLTRCGLGPQFGQQPA